MTEKEYYSEKRVSSSSLKWFEISPLFFKKMLDKEIEQESKRYFEIGKKIHMKLLEPKEYEKNYIYLEFDTPKTENQRKFCEDYIKSIGKSAEERLVMAYKQNYSCDKLSEDKIKERGTDLKKELSKYITYLRKRSDYKDILSYTDNNLINKCYSLTREHIAASKLIFLSDEDRMSNIEEFNEQVVFFDWMGVQCKSMIDRLIIDHVNKVIKLVDIKTTANLGDFAHSFEEFSYYRQMAFYWGAILSNWKYPDYKHETYIVAFQKGDLPECRVFSINENWLNWGLNDIEDILPQIKWHFDNNQWEHKQEYYTNNGIEIL